MAHEVAAALDAARKSYGFDGAVQLLVHLEVLMRMVGEAGQLFGSVVPTRCDTPTRAPS